MAKVVYRPLRFKQETQNFGGIMADAANKYSQNVPGKFYVDIQCIDCDACRETARELFTRYDDGGYSYVKKQPETPEEEESCQKALEGCPVDAIGANGDASDQIRA